MSIMQGWKILPHRGDLSELFDRAFGTGPVLARLRKTRADRSKALGDESAIAAWCASAVIRSERIKGIGQFDKDRLAKSMRSIGQSSSQPDGISKVSGMLAKLGIALVILPHLPKTHLDGAALLRADGTPVVALTIRRDDIASFWFTLMHELAHVRLHLDVQQPVIVDDLDIGSTRAMEGQANRVAEGALIPSPVWSRFDTGEYLSRAELDRIASEAGVHPAIVAARWRLENGNYRKFSKLLGKGEVRKLFPEWEEHGY